MLMFGKVTLEVKKLLRKQEAKFTRLKRQKRVKKIEIIKILKMNYWY
jgi:hypothetical protein